MSFFFFAKAKEQTTSGQSNLIGTEQDRDYYQNNRQKRKMSVIFAS
jgi:hypothetical protein